MRVNSWGKTLSILFFFAVITFLILGTVGPCLVRQSVQKAKFSALCKCLSSLSDLEKIPHFANFFRFFLIFRNYARLYKNFEKSRTMQIRTKQGPTVV